jgi:threonine aldolase
LKTDNDNAKKIGAILRGLPYVENLCPVMTNIVIFDVKSPLTGDLFLKKIGEHGVQAALFGPNTVRFVTHLHITDDMINELIAILKNLKVD